MNQSCFGTVMVPNWNTTGVAVVVTTLFVDYKVTTGRGASTMTPE